MVVYDPTTDSREMLRKILEVSEENHKMLKKIERRDRYAKIFRIVYWVFILGTAVGAYYFLQPYIGVFESTFNTLMGSLEQLQGLSR